jgi:hypothetical protein
MGCNKMKEERLWRAALPAEDQAAIFGRFLRHGVAVS